MPQTDAPVIGATQANRLRWWTELPLIFVVYAAYMAGRMFARSDTATPGTTTPTDRGLAILHAERALHLNLEEPLNRLFRAHLSIGLPADFWYASLHYAVTPAIAVWLFRSHPVRYRLERTWLLLSTFVGLIGFTFLPTCPPRLLAAGYGFVDTMAEFSHYGWWGDEASAPRGLGGMTNQYAAMPSLHVGWSVWCGLMLWRYGGARWTRVAAVGYPLITTIVVMGTANHYLFDALAGIAVMGISMLLTRPALRATDRARTYLAPRVAPVWTAVAARLTSGDAIRPAPALAAGSSAIVGDGCQTSAGERIPRQRKQRAEPSAQPADAGDGAAAPAG